MENSNVRKERGKDAAFYGSVIENADYLADIDINKKWNKRGRVDVDDSRWDKNYRSFFVDLEDYLESTFGEEDEVEDPVYAAFLKNLKEYGKAYMLNASKEHGVRTPIIYEGKIDPFVNGSKRKSPRTRQSLRELKSDSENSNFVSEVETDSSNVTKKRKTSTTHEQYNFQKGGRTKNSRFANKVETDSPDTIMREARMRHGYNMRGRRVLETEKKVDSGPTKSAFVCKVEKDLDDVIKKTSLSQEDSHIQKNGSLGVNKGFKARTRGDSNIQKKGEFHEDRTVKSGCAFPEKGAKDVDETYNSFFVGLKIVGDSMLYEFGNNQKIFYEGCGQQKSSDDKNEAALPTPPSTEPITSPTPLPTPHSAEPITTSTPLSPTVNRSKAKTSVIDNALDKNGKDSKKNHSKLWRELTRILGKPFDQNEFDELWKQMTYRSQVQVYRDSRSGGTYRPGQMGNSYLDKYPELNEEIKKVESDQIKVLNLLRMLYFYLQKCPHGIPRPWTPEYRKMFLA